MSKMVKILIAEDERDIRELILFTLKFAGFDVTAARDGRDAVEKAQQDKYDLILMDVRMPRMTGYQACDRLKEIESTKDIPVVFLSAKGQESEVSHGLQVGAEDYILKPFAPDQLTKQIREILTKYGKI
jgi:DNA-binding response OmpR family regulator